MGPSRALIPVLILIGASCSWPGLKFDSIVGLSRTLSCKLLFFSCNCRHVNFSSSSRGAWDGLTRLNAELKVERPSFSRPTWVPFHPILLLPPSPELLREQLQMTTAWQPVLGHRPRDLGSGRAGVRSPWLCSGIRCCRLLFPKAILTTDFYIEKLSFMFKRWGVSQSLFSLPIWLLRFQSEMYFLLIRIIYYP